MSSTNLNELLRETNALLAPVKPNPVWNSELSSLAGYQPMHALKLMLTELIQIIDKHRLDIVKCQSEIVPITAPSSSLSSVPCTMTNTIESSQNERSAVLSVENEESSLVSDTLSQNNNSEILTVHFDENYGVSSTNIAPLQNNISNSKNKNEADEGALRRKYKNKYRYLNVSQALSTEPKKNIICRDSNYIPEPYRNTLFKNIKSVRIINSQTNKSVIKPLSFIHPRIVIKKIDVANCAAVAPRIKKYVCYNLSYIKMILILYILFDDSDNGNSLQSRSPSNNHSASHDECKVINKRRNIRNSKITNKK